MLASAICVIILGQASPSTGASIGPLLDQSLAAHRALQRTTVRIERRSRAGFGEDFIQATVRIERPHQAHVVIRKKDLLDQSYSVVRGSVRGLDRIMNEYIDVSASARGSLTERMRLVWPVIEEPVSVILSPSELGQVYAGLRSRNGWTIRREGGKVRMTTRQEPNATVELDGRSMLLTSLRITGSGINLDWRISYGAPSPEPFALSSGTARSVSRFTPLPEASYANRTTRDTVVKMLKALAYFRAGTIEIDEDGRTIRLTVGPEGFQQEERRFAWAWDRRTLTIRNDNNATFTRGGVRRTGLLDAITAAGGRVDPMMRSWILRRVPYLESIPAEAQVAVQGTSTVGGRATTLLRVETVRNVTTMMVRNDGRLESLRVETKGAEGRPGLDAIVRSFSYRPQSTRTFRLSRPPRYRQVSVRR